MSDVLWRLAFLFAGIGATMLGHILWYRWQRQEKVPEDFAIFKAALEATLTGSNTLIAQRFDELDRRVHELAESVNENRRDYVGLRTNVERMAGQMNFTLWRRETDKPR